MTQMMRARIAGLAMRALAGIWKHGMTSNRFADEDEEEQAGEERAGSAGRPGRSSA